MTAAIRSCFCLALAVTGLNSTFAQGIILEGNSLSNRYYNSDVVPGDTVFAVDFTVTIARTLQDIVSWGENSGVGIPGVGETFHAYVLRPTGANFQVMTDSGALTVANIGTNFFAVPPFSLEAGDLIAHYGRGIPLATVPGGPSTAYFSGSVLPMPSVGDSLQLPGPDYPLYTDGGRDYAIAVNIGARVVSGGSQILNIAQAGGSVVVSWSAADTNALLQTTDLAVGPWTTNTSFIPSNGTNILTVPSPVGNMFFRLGNP
ncbi:MAG: hypothetical protein ACLQVY_25525 [Limisphaerales bacterium]